MAKAIITRKNTRTNWAAVCWLLMGAVGFLAVGVLAEVRNEGSFIWGGLFFMLLYGAGAVAACEVEKFPEFIREKVEIGCEEK